VDGIITFEGIFEVLKELQYKKTLVYKDSWKRRGEVLGILANIARKYDRIEAIVVDGVRATNDETLLDTLADLAVYSAKYLTYLAEFYESIFVDFINQYPPTEDVESYYYNDGFDSVSIILIRRYRSSLQIRRISDLEGCFQIIKQEFELLESLLIDGDWRSLDSRKCSATADLAISAIHAVLLLAREDSSQFERFSNYVENL
jgi:uncharacterized protein YfbU (UPF0304 family)